MASEVDIFNLACGILGVPRVQSISESTRHAQILNSIWGAVRRKVISDHPWNHCTKRAALTQLGDTPPYGWDYQYSMPDDYIRALQINDAAFDPSSDLYAIELDGSGESQQIVLRTDAATVNLKYVADVTNSGLFPPGLVFVMANELARHAAPSFRIDATRLQYLAVVREEDRRDGKATDGQEGSPPEIDSDILINARLGA